MLTRALITNICASAQVSAFSTAPSNSKMTAVRFRRSSRASSEPWPANTVGSCPPRSLPGNVGSSNSGTGKEAQPATDCGVSSSIRRERRKDSCPQVNTRVSRQIASSWFRGRPTKSRMSAMSTVHSSSTEDTNAKSLLISTIAVCKRILAGRGQKAPFTRS